MTLKIYCFKWGTKYSPEYVNRLFHSVIKNYKGNIIFTCITDDKLGLDSNINIIDYDSSKIIGLGNVFTIEKLKLFAKITFNLAIFVIQISKFHGWTKNI